jgi:hypothetical protein
MIFIKMLTEQSVWKIRTNQEVRSELCGTPGLIADILKNGLEL